MSKRKAETIEVEGGLPESPPELAPVRRLPVDTIPVSFEYKGMTWTVEMRDDPLVRSLEALVEGGDFESRKQVVADLIVDWDLVDHRGVALPAPSLESVGMVPGRMLLAMIRALIDAVGKIPNP